MCGEISVISFKKWSKKRRFLREGDSVKKMAPKNGVGLRHNKGEDFITYEIALKSALYSFDKNIIVCSKVRR